MAVQATRVHNQKLLPTSLEAALKRGFSTLFGGSLVGLSVLGWVSLLSWSVSDPSFNRVTASAPVNYLGIFGAAFADLLFQFIGLASIFALLPLAIWGLYLCRGVRPRYMRWRILAWPLAIMLIAGLISFAPKAASWPLPTGYGGIFGDMVFTVLSDLSRKINPIYGHLAMIVLIFALAATLICFTIDCTLADLARLIHFGDHFSPRIMISGSLSKAGYLMRKAKYSHKNRAFDQRRWWRNAVLNDAPPDCQRREQQPVYCDHEYGGNAYDQGRSSDPQSAAHIAPVNQSVGPGNDPQSYSVFGLGRFAANGKLNKSKISQGAPPTTTADTPPPIPVQTKPDPSFTVSRKQPPARAKTKPNKLAPNPFSLTGRRSARSDFALPSFDLLNEIPQKQNMVLDQQALQAQAAMLEDVLLDFGVKGEIINIHPGPVVTLFEFQPARGTKTARVVGLADDIARTMSALSARIAVIPGRNALGIELPNESREIVYMRALLESDSFRHEKSALPLVLGKSISGEPVLADLASMPHLLIAGTTGSGKSVGINTIILSLLYRFSPAHCRMIMIDPKMLELSVYDGIPHLLSPVVTDPKKAVAALKWTVREMEERYRKMSKLGVRNISGYNEKISEAKTRGEPLIRTVQTGFDQQTGEAIFEQEQLDFETLPFIVVVIDEMADLMMVAGKEIEAALLRLAQMARAAGIHLITATQRPSVDVITGTIKANFPTRISFQVTSKIDSRTILGDQGAEQLLGKGDMLYMAGGSRMVRVHGAFVEDQEVEEVANYLRAQGVPQYLDDVTAEIPDTSTDNSAGGDGNDLYSQAVAIVLQDRKASISYVQRRLSIGYNRAATLIERMEEDGLIGPAGRAGKREILVDNRAQNQVESPQLAQRRSG